MYRILRLKYVGIKKRATLMSPECAYPIGNLVVLGIKGVMCV